MIRAIALALAWGGRLDLTGVLVVAGEDLDAAFCPGRGGGVFLGPIKRTARRIAKQKPETTQKSEAFPEESMGLRKLAVSGSLKPGSNPAFLGLPERLSVAGSSRLTPGGMGKM